MQLDITPGPSRVSITLAKVRPANTEGGTPSGKLLAPARYANATGSGPEVQVAAGSNQHDFELESGRSK